MSTSSPAPADNCALVAPEASKGHRRALFRIQKPERRVVDREGPDGAGLGVAGLEPHGHPAEAEAPDPAPSMIVMSDVGPGPPTRCGARVRRGMIMHHDVLS